MNPSEFYVLALGLLRFVQPMLLSTIGSVAGRLTVDQLEGRLRDLSTTDDLPKVLQEAFIRSIKSISGGLSGKYGLTASKEIKEFGERLESQYLDPFCEKNGWDPERRSRFRRDQKRFARVLVNQAEQIFRIQTLTRESMKQLLLPIAEVENVNQLQTLREKARLELLGQITSIEGVEDLFAEFLAERDLLLTAILFFIEVRIKKDSRFANLMTHYDLQTIKIELAKQAATRDSSAEYDQILTALEEQSSSLTEGFGLLTDITAEGFDLVLAEIEEVQLSISEIGDRVAHFEETVLAAIKGRDYDGLIELVTALAELGEQRRRHEESVQHREEGKRRYDAGLLAAQAGDEESAGMEFHAAEDSFRLAVDAADESDSNFAMYLTDLGNSLTMQARTEDAIAFYERALQLVRNYEAAANELSKRMLDLGLAQHNQKKFDAACESFEYGMVLSSDEDFLARIRPSLAAALNEKANEPLRNEPTSVDFVRAKLLILRAISLDPSAAMLQNNLRQLQGGANRSATTFFTQNQPVPADRADGGGDPDSLSFDVWLDEGAPEAIQTWLDLILPEFPELGSRTSEERRPIHVWWLHKGQETKQRLEQIGIPDREEVFVAMSHMHDNQHFLVLSAEYHTQLDDELALVGNLVQRLASEAFKRLGGTSHLPDWAASPLTEASNQRLIDLLVIYRGLGPFLRHARAALQSGGKSEGDYTGLELIEIERILRREEEQGAKRRMNNGARLRKEKSDAEAQENFTAAALTWKRILRRDPDYAFGWFQLAVSHRWLHEEDQAVLAAQEAVRRSVNPRYRTELDESSMSRERQARQLINDGSSLDNAGKFRPARRLFERAEAIWRGYLSEYHEVARVHYELGLSLEWQKRIPEALYELRAAVALDPRSDKYTGYLRSALVRYGNQ